MQANSTRDGQTFMNCFAVGLVLIGEHPFLVGIQSAVPELCSNAEAAQIKQEQHALIEQIRILLEQGVSHETKQEIFGKDYDCILPRRRSVANSEAFFQGRLSDRVILANNHCTVMRREPWEIPRGCVVTSEEPLKRTPQGLFFSIRLEGVLSEGWNSSWPMLGMTQITPSDIMESGYPMKAEWFGKSVCIGGEFQAWIRDKPTHLKALFGKPKADEIMSYDGPRPRWQDRNTTPWELSEGDVMSMLYTPEGVVHLMLNYLTVLSVDTERPLQEGPYYALVDCQGQAYEITRLPFDNPVAACSHGLALEPKISHKMLDYVAKTAASRAISSCAFSVSIADPSQPDMPLVAVSPGFERMTGYSTDEIVGLNCRFLNHDCDMDFGKRARLRDSCRTGSPYTSMLQNRRKSGELFWNLLDLRGLRVACDSETEEDIWYLVGIQSDISEIVGEDMTEDATSEIHEAHEKELQRIAEHLRNELQKEFAQFALASRLEVVHSDACIQNMTKTVEEDYPEDLTKFEAAPGIQAGPKPELRPNIVLLSEPSWISETEPAPEPDCCANHSNCCHRNNMATAVMMRKPRTYGLAALGALLAGVTFAIAAKMKVFQNRKLCHF
jgi:PAS domain S-box-containing protein